MKKKIYPRIRIAGFILLMAGLGLGASGCGGPLMPALDLSLSGAVQLPDTVPETQITINNEIQNTNDNASSATNTNTNTSTSSSTSTQNNTQTQTEDNPVVNGNNNNVN